MTSGGTRAAFDGAGRRIAEAVAAAGGATVAQLGLRFDRVVVRVLDRLRLHLAPSEPEGLTVLLTLTAPIRAPGTTAAALELELASLLRAGRAGAERTVDLQGSRAEMRLIARSPRPAPWLLGFVHNPGVPAARVLDLAERWLRSDG